MPEIPPAGIFPLFLRSVTTEKYGFKTGDGVMDLVDHVMIKKDDLTKEIQTLGVMSDFEPAKKYIDGFNGDEILFVVDKAQQYGEIYLVCYTHESRDEYFKKLEEIQLARDEQRKAEEEIEAARLAAEVARRNIQYVDKPLTPRLWKSHATLDTENELRQLNYKPPRELISYEITRLKKSTKLPVRFSAKIGGAVEFRAYRDLNFKGIRESDMGIQVAPPMVESSAQTTWYRPINKSVQYEAPECEPEPNDEKMDDLLDFLERVTMKVESALQQNEAVDIFHETFRMIGDDEIHEGMHAEDELREIKNFADPTYSKSKAVVAIDWLPKMQGMVAVSVVKNVSFDQRVAISGQTSTAHVLLWDFRHLVKPQLIMQSNFEVFAFRFNKTKPGIVAGGTITGQVVLWDVNDIVSALNKQRNQSSRKVSLKAITTETEEDENKLTPIAPKYISHVDHSHKRCVADLLWLPPNTQINYRGQLVGAEHLDNQSYQFVTVAADGMVMIWDIRYEEIALDELKHIGRAKHIPFEKSSTNKDAGKPLWAPIFKAPLKRMEGVGELSLCKVSCSSSLKTSVASNSSLPGDNRSHFMLSTEEGDVIFADICARKSDGFGAAGVGVGVGGQEADEDEAESAREYVRWTARDHPRPCVSLQLSPFFPDILLSVGDWCFHIWKVNPCYCKLYL